MIDSLCDDPVTYIEQWFKRHCNGTWEHMQTYISFESTDNPGWQATLKHQPLVRGMNTDWELKVKHKYPQAQCLVRGNNLVIFAPTLQECLGATALICGSA
jgi:hypothetical protein